MRLALDAALEAALKNAFLAGYAHRAAVASDDDWEDDKKYQREIQRARGSSILKFLAEKYAASAARRIRRKM